MNRSLLSVLLFLVGCSSSPKHANEPMQQGPAPQVEQPAASTFAPAGDTAPGSDAPATSFEMADWQRQFSETLADLERLDCPNACRALGSLERSAENICGIAGGSSSSCQDVTKKREDARTRVKTRCGACP